MDLKAPVSWMSSNDLRRHGQSAARFDGKNLGCHRATPIQQQRICYQRTSRNGSVELPISMIALFLTHGNRSAKIRMKRMIQNTVLNKKVP